MIRRFLPLISWCYVLLSIHSSWGKIVLSTTNELKIYDVIIDDVHLTSVNHDQQVFDQAQLVGVEGYYGIYYQEGAPSLPVVRIYVDADSRNQINISSEPNETDKIQNNKYLPVKNYLPVIASTAKSLSQQEKIFQGPAFQQLLFPAMKNNYLIEKVGSIRGVGRYLVTLFPVVYQGQQKNILWQKKHFVISVNNSSLHAKEKYASTRSSLKDLFLVSTKFKKSPALEKYIALKKELQHSYVKVVYISPKDTAFKIRSIIQNVYDNFSSLQYVTIIGDAEDVTALKTETTNSFTDHYYAAIDTDNYENDVNTPDLYVGRISVTTEEQLAAVLQKNATYLQKNFLANHEFKNFTWAQNISFIATNDRYEIAEGTHNYVVNHYSANHGFEGNFPNASNQGGDQLYAITFQASDAQVLSSINEGRSIIDYSGHGNYDGWYGPTLHQTDVPSLSNAALPFVISNACLTGNYIQPESFAETWQRHPQGSIVFWGSTTYTYWDEDDILERTLFDDIFSNQERNFGAMTTYALAEVWKYYGGAGKSKYYWEAYHLFGDPSLNLVID